MTYLYLLLAFPLALAIWLPLVGVVFAPAGVMILFEKLKETTR